MAKNPYLKSANKKEEYTYDQIEELQKCYQNPVYFIKNYVKIIHGKHGLVPFDLYPYQENMIESFKEEQYTIVLSARQTGKCVNGNTKVTIIDTKKITWFKELILWMFDNKTFNRVFS